MPELIVKHWRWIALVGIAFGFSMAFQVVTDGMFMPLQLCLSSLFTFAVSMLALFAFNPERMRW